MSTAPIRVLVGTGNQHKLEEITDVFSRSPLHVDVTGTQSLPHIPEIEETGATFDANAELKAVGYARAALALPPADRPDVVIADDSGLCVDCLNGAPGVYSARYAGAAATDADNNAKLLAELEDTAATDRSAAFVCVIAIVPLRGDLAPDADLRATGYARGRVEGQILEKPCGAAGFGYDPLFFYEPFGCTFAEVSQQKKASVSHRGQALAELSQMLAEFEA